MISIIFALIAAVGWGIADIFGGLVAKKIGGYSSAVVSYILCLVIASLYIPFAIQDLSGITISTIIWLIIITPISVVPLIALYKGFEKGNASLIGTIGGSNGILVIPMSLIFLGETINRNQTICIILVIFGVLLASLDFTNLKIKNIFSDKGVPYALVAMITWAIWYTFVKIPIDNIGWFWPAYTSWLGFPLALWYMKAKKLPFTFPKDKRHIFYSVLNALLLTAALFAYNFALTSGQNAIVSPVSSTYPVLFAVIAYFVFKDRLTKQQLTGMALTLAGIVFLSFA